MYLELTEQELIEKKKLAGVWLFRNKTHPRYWEALQRFFKIRRALRLKLGKDLALRKEFNAYVKKTPHFKKWFWDECLRLENICPECNQRMGGKDRIATTDHIIDLSDGGENDFPNFRVICDVCNHAKDLKKRGFSANEIYNKLLHPKKIKKLKKALGIKVAKVVEEIKEQTPEKEPLSRLVWDALFIQ